MKVTSWLFSLFINFLTDFQMQTRMQNNNPSSEQPSSLLDEMEDEDLKAAIAASLDPSPVLPPSSIAEIPYNKSQESSNETREKIDDL